MKDFVTIKDTIESMQEYAKMANEQQFIYQAASNISFFAIKIENGAVLINGENKFIVAKAYKNCLSIGSNMVYVFNTYEEAVKNAPTVMEKL